MAHFTEHMCETSMRHCINQLTTKWWAIQCEAMSTMWCFSVTRELPLTNHFAQCDLTTRLTTNGFQTCSFNVLSSKDFDSVVCHFVCINFDQYYQLLDIKKFASKILFNLYFKFAINNCYKQTTILCNYFNQ